MKIVFLPQISESTDIHYGVMKLCLGHYCIRVIYLNFEYWLFWMLHKLDKKGMIIRTHQTIFFVVIRIPVKLHPQQLYKEEILTCQHLLFLKYGFMIVHNFSSKVLVQYLCSSWTYAQSLIWLIRSNEIFMKWDFIIIFLNFEIQTCLSSTSSRF